MRGDKASASIWRIGEFENVKVWLNIGNIERKGFSNDVRNNIVKLTRTRSIIVQPDGAPYHAKQFCVSTVLMCTFSFLQHATTLFITSARRRSDLEPQEEPSSWWLGYSVRLFVSKEWKRVCSFALHLPWIGQAVLFLVPPQETTVLTTLLNVRSLRIASFRFRMHWNTNARLWKLECNLPQTHIAQLYITVYKHLHCAP